MKKYGLQLRAPASQQKKSAVRPPLPPPAGFRDDDEDDVEREISRQASKNKSLRDVEELHKKALEEDPSVFDYDGVYDDMKEKVALPRAQDRQERKPKYIQSLIKKAEERKREQEIIYERKLAKERSQDDHLYADKDKYVTTAYKNKLAEQAKWVEEERLRQLKEEKDDVTKKKDLSDFYFNLEKNVAFGGGNSHTNGQNDIKSQDTMVEEKSAGTIEHEDPLPGKDQASESSAVREEEPASEETKQLDEDSPEKAVTEVAGQQPATEPPPPNPNHHKRDDSAVNAAKERFLARKRAKLQ